jgi:hypothetical protein
MDVMELLVAGGVAAALFKIIDSLIQYSLGRWGKKKDNKDVLKDALKVILLDRILYLGRAYIQDGEVDADDRRRLIAMHDVYHSLGGNGDADLIMNCVKCLPFKKY